MRVLATLIAAGAVSGALAPTALAGVVEATPEIYGSGSIPAGGYPQVVPCEQQAQSGTDHEVCAPWKVDGKGLAPNVVLTAVPAPGWTFQGWSGCEVVNASYCQMTAPAGDETRTY